MRVNSFIMSHQLDSGVLVPVFLMLTFLVGQYHLLSLNSSVDVKRDCDRHQTISCSNTVDTVEVTHLNSSSESELRLTPQASTFVHCKARLEFACLSHLQCIPIGFVCDKQYDCQDKSDEIGCSAPSIVSKPPRALSGLEHGAINISCEASGLPKPTIYWTHNGSRLTARESEISTSSVTQIGTSGVLLSNSGSDGPLMYYVMSTIQIIYLNQQDAGYWGCHAYNNQGDSSSLIETLLTIRQKASVCRDPPYFNDLATSKDECLKCYCSGVSDTCFSSSKYLSKLHLARRPRIVNILMTTVPIHRDMGSTNKNLSWESSQYPSYREVNGGYTLPVYNTSLGQYYTDNRQGMLDNIHSSIYYYYKVELNDLVESKAVPSGFEYDDESYPLANTDSQFTEGSSRTRSLIRSYGGYIRFSLIFNILSDSLPQQDKETISWSSQVERQTEQQIEQGSKKETTSLLRELADIILLCQDGQIIYHRFNMYGTSIVANQKNHLSVPLLENYWQVGVTHNLNYKKDRTLKKPGSIYPTAPYNYDVDHLTLVRNDKLISSNSNHDGANNDSNNTTSNLDDLDVHQIHSRSDLYDMSSTGHDSQIVINRDQFMHCLSDVKAIYIRAIHNLHQVSFNISSIYIDTAVGNQWNSTMGADLQAPLIEQCVCPNGYQGTSCEICSNGYERHQSPPFCKLKIRSRSTETDAPNPHYSHYYNQSASILPNISLNSNTTSEYSPTVQESSKHISSGNCSCTPNNDSCDPITDPCENCNDTHCDIPNNVNSQPFKLDSYFVEIDEPKNISVFIGNQVKFKCTLRENSTSTNNTTLINENQPEITLVWSRLFKPGPHYTSRSSFVNRVSDGSELRLNNVTLEDSGLYMCEIGQNVSNILSDSTSNKDPKRDFANLIVNDIATSNRNSNDNNSNNNNNSDDDLIDYDDEDNASSQNTTPTTSETINSSDHSDSMEDSYDVSQFFSTNLTQGPNIRIIPDYLEAPLGGSSQLFCLGDADQPDMRQVEWSHLSQNTVVVHGDQSSSDGDGANFQLPPNITIQQNILTIDSIGESHAGIYICKASNRFNMTTEATARLVIVPSEETPPQVFIEPENLSGRIDDSIEIKCFASGYPGPKLNWVKVDPPHNNNNSKSRSSTLDGLRLFAAKQIPPNEIHMYREQTIITDHIGSGGTQSQRKRKIITSMSLLRIDGLKVAHSGQYICRATNNKGSNQASTNIDVDYQLKPTIVVSPLEQVVRMEKGLELESVRFECRVLDGRPEPKISWFKISTSARNSLNNIENSLVRPLPYRIGGLLHSSSMPIMLSIAASNTNNFDIQEYHNPDGHISILNFKRITMKEEGTYACVAENDLGQHSLVVNLQVVVPPTIRIMQQNPMNVNVDDSFQLECIVSGHPLPIEIEWSKRDGGSYFSFISKQNPLEEQERAVLRFDRVNMKDSGEYTCQAKNIVDDSTIEDNILINVNPRPSSSDSSPTNMSDSLDRSLSGPQLITRPSKILAMSGSNITIDCLAMSGQQPILIEWNRLVQPNNSGLSKTAVARFYQQDSLISPMKTSVRDGVPTMSSMLQSGSKLKLYNTSKYHEGIYQCIGQNKNGRSSVSTEIRIIEPHSFNDPSKTVTRTKPNLTAQFLTPQTETTTTNNSTLVKTNDKQSNDSVMQTKTQMAIVGSNIELTCRVEGVADPAISWSREGERLPMLSIQIGHNLWIQNLNKNDTGRYICSARSSPPNRIIQDDITLIVRDSMNHVPFDRQPGHNWFVSIVPSKPYVKIGDSITLECLIKIQRTNNEDDATTSQDLDAIVDVDGNIKREIGAGLGPVTWTNSNTGQSWFQDNVYIQDNLLIIYDLSLENTAIYRCNHNDINQYTEYSLVVLEDDEDVSRHIANMSKNPTSSLAPIQIPSSNTIPVTATTTTTTTEVTAGINYDNENYHNIQTPVLTNEQRSRRALIRRVPIDSRVVLECPFGSDKARVGDIQNAYSRIMSDIEQKSAKGWSHHFKELEQKDVVHYWWTKGPRGARLAADQPYIINTVSTLDADTYICQGIFKNAGGKLERFYYIPIILAVDRLIARFVQNPVSFIALPTITGAYFQLKIEIRFLPERDSGLILYNGQYKTPGDFISLGLNRGHFEFRFELGDGLTLLRSHLPLAMNQWHNVVIERDRRMATMLVDQQAIVSNTSTGKFYNLDLDSLLYIGGHQYYYDRYQANLINRQLNRRANLNDKWTAIDNIGLRGRRSNSSSTKSNSNSSTGKLRTKFYGFSQGFHGCISHLRVSNQDINLTTKDRAVSIGIYECHRSQCYGSRCNSNNSYCQHEDFKSIMRVATAGSKLTTQTVQPQLRCICFPGFSGPDCGDSSADKQDSCSINKAKQHCGYPRGRCVSVQRAPSDGVDEKLDYECQCRIGFKGKRCEDRINSSSPPQKRSSELNFDSSISSWLAIQQKPTTTAIFKLKIQIRLRPSLKLLGKDSIILYSGQSASGVGDHIMLCIRQDGHIEFNFDTGSGVTTIRSENPIITNDTGTTTPTIPTTPTTALAVGQSNQWTNIVIERGLNEAILQIDDNPEIIKQLLEEAGQQQTILQSTNLQQPTKGQYLNRSALNIGLPFYFGDIDRHRNLRLPLYAQHFKPFDGCLSQLVINDYEYNLLTLVNRSVFDNNKTSLEAEDIDMNNDNNERFEYDTAFANLPSWFLDSSNIKLCNQDDRATQILEDKRQRSQDTMNSTPLTLHPPKINVTNPDINTEVMSDTKLQTEAPSSIFTVANKNMFCDDLSPCFNGATCYTAGSGAYKCHCPIGLMGDTCSMQASFTPETTVQFNENSYLSLRFVNLDELSRQQQQLASMNSTGYASFHDTNISNTLTWPPGSNMASINLTTLAKQLSMTERQTISFTLATTADYGLIFYHGQAIDPQAALINTKSALTPDYIAIALVNGYIELCYELGSGVALIRSATKVNDDEYHKILVTRNGRFATLNIDGIYIQEGVSSGKLSMLNALGDVYLGGLPDASRATTNRYMAGFQGCLLNLELNSHGPINLVRSDSLVQITSGRNISPCIRKSKTYESSTPSSDDEDSDR